MTRNVGTVDRAARAVLGLGALVWAFSTGMSSALGIGLIAVGAVLLVTAAVSFCPLYRLLGLSTGNASQHDARPVAR